MTAGATNTAALPLPGALSTTPDSARAEPRFDGSSFGTGDGLLVLRRRDMNPLLSTRGLRLLVAMTPTTALRLSADIKDVWVRQDVKKLMALYTVAPVFLR